MNQAAATAYQVEKNIPLPKHGNATRVSFASCLRGMEVGDSVLSGRDERATRSSVFVASRSTGFKFVVRETDAGVRVWRAA